MTTSIKLTIAALAVAATAVPAQALMPTRVISGSSTVASSTNPLYPEIENWSNSFTDPNPSSGANFTQVNSFDSTRNYPTTCSGIDCSPKNGYAATNFLVDLGAGVTKAKVSSYIAMDKPSFATNKTIADMSIDALNIDRITFTGLTPGANAVVKISTYAAVKFGIQNFQNSGGPITKSSSYFSYSAESLFYDNLAAANSPTGVVEQTSGPWLVCNNTRGCIGNNVLRNGYRYETKTFLIDSDDVLLIRNKLQLGSFLSVEFPIASASSGNRVLRQTNDFSNSAYTVIEMLTPGTGYESASGALYPTSLPPAVPEPASWAMLIAGFGLTGGAMRRRRQGAGAAAA